MNHDSNFTDDTPDGQGACFARLLARLTLAVRRVAAIDGNPIDAGAGYLVGHLKHAGHVIVGAYDLPIDAHTTRYAEAKPGVVFITNPPWRRDILHPIIVNLSNQAPAWLLIEADWAHTKQAIPYLPRLRKSVSIGRVRWIPDLPYDGKDNAVWPLFDRPQRAQGALFLGRQLITTTSRRAA